MGKEKLTGKGKEKVKKFSTKLLSISTNFSKILNIAGEFGFTYQQFGLFNAHFAKYLILKESQPLNFALQNPLMEEVSRFPIRGRRIRNAQQTNEAANETAEIFSELIIFFASNIKEGKHSRTKEEIEMGIDESYSGINFADETNPSPMDINTIQRAANILSTVIRQLTEDLIQGKKESFVVLEETIQSIKERELRNTSIN